MLNSVWFETSIDYVNAPSDLVKKMYADHDYDIGAASEYRKRIRTNGCTRR